MMKDFLRSIGLHHSGVEPEQVHAGVAGAPFVLVLTEHLNATCYINFERPLAWLHQQRFLNFAIASQARVAQGGEGCWMQWLQRWRPRIVVLSRYAQPFGEQIIADARAQGAQVLYHIDDDLLRLPPSLGQGVLQSHGAAEVVQARTALLAASHAIYASTAYLAQVMRERFPGQRVVSGEVACAFLPLSPAPPSQPPVVGYMGSRGHQNDLALAVPALECLMDERPELRFEVFGTIRMPPELGRFRNRVRSHAVQPFYLAFMEKLANLGWSLGLAPLADEPFNRCKTPTKFVEYTSAGIPCIASREPIYGSLIEGGEGLLVDDDWYAAISAWLDQPAEARAAWTRARDRCSMTYATERLAAQAQLILMEFSP